MKRILLLIGLGLIVWGILGLNELQRQRGLIPERPGYGIPEKDRENLAKDRTIATGLIVAGGLVFLWGLIPYLKPKQAAQAAATATPAAAPAPSVDAVAAAAGNTSADSLAQLERLAKLKEQGILTEEEFQKEKSKILG